MNRPPYSNRQRPSTRHPASSPQTQKRIKKRRKHIKRQTRVRKDYTLAIFEGIAKLFAAIGIGFKQLQTHKYFHIIVLAFVAVVLTGGGILTFNTLSRPNALRVQVDGADYGIMRWDRGEVDPDYLITHTLMRIQSTHNTDIFPTSEIIATPTRAGRNVDIVSFDHMVSTIIQNFAYSLDGGVIAVNGTNIAFLSNHNAAVTLIADIIASFTNDYTTESYLIDDVIISTSQLPHTDIMTPSQAFAILTAPRTVQQIHIAIPGDNMYNIAIAYGMTLPALLAANPTIEPANLRDGTAVVVLPNIPILSIRTYEHVTLEEEIEIDGQTVLARIVADLTKTNGIEVSRNILSTQTIQ